MSSRINRKLKDAWVDFLRPYDFDLFVTFKFNLPGHYVERGQYHQNSIEQTKKYYNFVSQRCFGKKAIPINGNGLQHATFFECLTKGGDPTVFHAHSLINTNGNYERVSSYLLKEWRKIKQNPRWEDPVITSIEKLESLIRYVTKHAVHNVETIINLPTVHSEAG
jgi:hypothetical protein